MNDKTILIDTQQFTDDELVSFFPFHEQKLYPHTYLFYLTFHLITAVMGVIVWIGERELARNGLENYSIIVAIYVWMEVVDIFLFVLSYGDPLRGFSIPWNVVKFLAFLCLVLAAKWLQSLKK